VSLIVAITATHTDVAKNALQLAKELKVTNYPWATIPVNILQWMLLTLKVTRARCLENSYSEHSQVTPYPSRMETAV
jgi:hypothetical protein